MYLCMCMCLKLYVNKFQCIRSSGTVYSSIHVNMYVYMRI